MRLVCYCCGAQLGESFVLVRANSSRRPDVVHVALPQHAKQSQEVETLRVRRMPEPGEVPS